MLGIDGEVDIYNIKMEEDFEDKSANFCLKFVIIPIVIISLVCVLAMFATKFGG